MSRIYNEPFALVPEWLLDGDVSDRAVRLFAVLHRYADKDGRAYPGRARLADRLRCSTASIDRAIGELEQVGAVLVERRPKDDKSWHTNNYYLWPKSSRVRGGWPTGEATPSLTADEGGSPTGDEQTKASWNESQLVPIANSNGVVTAATSLVNGSLFDRWWKAYPKKVAKPAAAKAFPAALKKAGSVELLIAAAERYANDPTRKPDYTANPATWLKDERWTDEPAESTTPKPKSFGAIARFANSGR